MTVIVVTHEPDVAAYAQRVITFKDGQILSDERNKARLTRLATPDHPGGY